MSFESAARDWSELREALTNEFSKTVSSKQVHQKLSAARKKQDESCQEYIYRMLELASPAEIEREVNIQYIIERILDDENNKSVLYGASTIKELRKRLAQYELQRAVMRNKTKDRPIASKPKKGDREDADMKIKRCFNCGHVGKECPSRSKGVKCFSCGEFGHTAARCFKQAGTSTKAATPKARQGNLC